VEFKFECTIPYIYAGLQSGDVTMDDFVKQKLEDWGLARFSKNFDGKYNFTTKHFTKLNNVWITEWFT
jgi:hypothetical protein